MSTSTQWFQDRASGEYYRWSAQEGCYIYQSGRRSYPSQMTQQNASQAPTQSAPRGQHQAQHRLRHDQHPFNEHISPSYGGYTTRRKSFASSGGSTASGLPEAESSQGATIEQHLGGLHLGTEPAGSSQYTPVFNDPVKWYGQRPQGPDWNRVPPEPSAPAGSVGNQRGKARAVHKEIEATPGDYERLDPRYKKRNSGWFKQGRVFKMHWSQPSGREDDDATAITPRREHLPKQFENQLPKEIVRDRRFGQYIHSKIRFFIVIRPGPNKCICVPIVSYGGQGTAKPGVVKYEHAIAYTGKVAVGPHPTEESDRGKRPMLTSIRIKTDERGDKLDPMSRIDYGRTYTVEHNVKAMAFGWVHEDSEKDLEYSFYQVILGPALFASMMRSQRSRARSENDDEIEDDENEDDDDDDDENEDDKNEDDENEDDDDDDDDDDGGEGNVDVEHGDSNSKSKMYESRGCTQHQTPPQQRTKQYPVDVRAGRAYVTTSGPGQSSRIPTSSNTLAASTRHIQHPSRSATARPMVHNAAGPLQQLAQHHNFQSSYSPASQDNRNHEDEEDEGDSDSSDE